MSRPSASAPPPSAAAPPHVAASEPLPLAPPLVGRHLDRPVLGPLDGDLLIAGWAVSADGPLERVLALAGDASPLHVRADRERPDIAELHPDVPDAAHSGFRLRVPAAVAQRLGELTIVAELPAGRRIPLWRLELAPARPADAAPRPPAEPAPARRRLGRRRAAPAPAAPAPPARAPEPPAGLAPSFLDDAFRVVALIAAYNEADIIEPVLDHLAANGVWSYLIDNGSTDETVARAQRRLGRGLLGIERLADPDGGRTSWRALLARKRELARELGADWYVHHDADEIRESPWPGMTLREAIRWVDRAGCNAIDFRVLNFAPVDDAFRAGTDPRTHFRRWEDPGEYDLMQRKCWKAGFADLELAEGGHDVRFAGRRLFPLRFLLRHYPIRGQAHGLRKVFEERKDRFTDAERAFGWHRQYDHVERPDHLFLRNPAALRPFDLDAIRLETLLHDAAAAAREPAPAAGPPAADARGFLDEVSPRRISGWAAREDGEPVRVEIWDGARLIATVAADEPRTDLAEQGIADGRGGFALPTPRELLDGRPHWIWATVAGGDVALRRSPLVLHAAGRVSLGAASEPAGAAVEVG
ncbi:MAG TPA: glycosyltransferase family 2 protein [Conexibacter sp.]|nr:glycosyltransferase family 2 protein [Conexibacter sp.]